MTEIRKIRGKIVLGGLLVFITAATADAGLTLRYEGILAGATEVTRPVRPTAVTVNPVSGEICVTDDGARSLLVYNSHNIHTFMTGNIAGMSNPQDGSIELWGGFVCTDRSPSGERTIRRLNYLGEPEPFEVERPSEDWSPGHLLVTRNGNLVTVDRASGRLAMHDGETGELLWTRMPLEEAREEGLIIGRPAEAPDGRIFVPGGELRYVLVFSPEGELLSTFGVPGGGRGELAFPVGIAFGYRGTILVLDRMRHAILAFDEEFHLLSEHGSLGARPGNLYHPTAIAALPDGRLWVAQGFEGRVQAFRLVETNAETSGYRGAAS